MNVLALVHGANVPPGIFGEEVEERGHRLDVWSLAWGTPPPRPIDDYAAVLVLGGAMHADQDDRHPWLRDETFFLERLLDLHVPLLGVCLGAQLIARAAHAPVRRCSQPEVGWVEVQLTAEAADDPVFSRLPPRFLAFQWHFYEHEVPPGGRELARSSVCTQAFRLGNCVWGVQFHPEVTEEVIECWIAESPEEVPCPPEHLRAETARNLEEWQEIGRTLCSSFLEVAEHAGVPA
ncbi:MAG: type 1 glutamine amidotransferase [Chloroflexota bacterium]